jgi:hypothetical protein
VGLLRIFRDVIESISGDAGQSIDAASPRRLDPMFGDINPRAKAKAPFISVAAALEEIRRGQMVILMDDEERENEGDLCMAAEKATPEAINFMAKHGRGSKRRRSMESRGALAAVAGTATPAGPVRVAAVEPRGPLTSYDIFRLCIERAHNLIRIHEAAHGRQERPERFLSDAHRAAIVLAVAALDAYVRSFVIQNVRRILANKGAEIPASLASRIKSYLKEDGLLEAARKDDLLDRVEKAMRDEFEKRSFQRTNTSALNNWT